MMNLKDILLNEISQLQKDKYCIISLEIKSKKQKFLKNAKLIETENGSVTRGYREEVMGVIA